LLAFVSIREKPTVAVASSSTTSSSQSEVDAPPKLAEEESHNNKKSVSVPRKKRRLDNKAKEEEEGLNVMQVAQETGLLDAYEPVPLQDLNTTLPPQVVTCDSCDMEVVSLMASEFDEEDDLTLGEEVYFPQKDAELAELAELAWEGDLGLLNDDLSFADLQDQEESESEGRHAHAAVSFDGAEESTSTIMFLDDVRDACSLPFATMSLSTIDFDNIFDEQRVAQELELHHITLKQAHTQRPDHTLSATAMQVSPATAPALISTVSLEMDAFDLDEGVFQLLGGAA
jgi:hypothetical protein